ncbi:MAG: type III pantothenate kinase [Bacteroidales bacterium]|nr:type III pantothenate kinase [Bacteroidales bacterium]MBD5219849.1 type III pantothenate kinase [Bacteroidales bacterium]MDE6436645.1 type III pantothenate kinase [Muribaculaceae bacterium]
MDYKLTIDRGNTAIKGAVWSAENRLVGTLKGDADKAAGDLALQLMERFNGGEPFVAGIYCSVVASDRDDDVASITPLCHRLIELSSRTPLPFTIEYRTPQTLGADRIAAIAGALSLAGDTRPLLVADIGTAVTYDFVARGRRYVGGNIAPGVDMRLRALRAFTDALPSVNADGDTPVWGTTTAEAMRSGAVRGVCAELEAYHRAAGDEALAVLTGGAAIHLANKGFLTFDYILDPCLVHKGLNAIINFNEDK